MTVTTVQRTCASFLVSLFMPLGIVLITAQPAAAQGTTYNQTTCANVGTNCVNPVVATVDCNAGGKLSIALTSITDRNGPNVINVSGNCTEASSLAIEGFNRLTIQGTATINPALNIVNSRDILLSGALTFVRGLSLNDSGVVANGGVTVQNINSNQNGISVGGGSNLNFGTGNATVSNITGVGRDGINVGPGSNAVISNATITGWNRGVRSHDGGQVTINGGSGPVDISNNGVGVTVENQGGLVMFASANPIQVHDNAASGIEIILGRATIIGSIAVNANGLLAAPGDDNNGISVFASLVQIAGVTFSGNAGYGAVIDLRSTVALGDPGSTPPTNGITETGNILGGVSVGHGSMVAALMPNVIGTMGCDDSSWVFGDLSGVTTNTCPLDNPRGGIGPQGLPGTNGTNGVDGAQGLPGQNGTDGAPGVSGRLTITATGPATVAKAATATVTANCTSPQVPLGGGGATNNANLVMISSGPTATGWSVAFRNIASNNQAGLVLTATAVCATALP